MSVHTPKRPTLPPLTPSSHGAAAAKKMTLPPLSEVLKSVSFHTQLPPRILTAFQLSPQTPLPPADNTINSSTDTPLRPYYASNTSHTSHTSNNDSFECDDSMDRSISPVSSKPAKTSFAFISHSPSTFPLQCPTIDNAPLARRRRRRTSPTELAILNAEYELGSTPNKLRRLDIAAKVNMDEKAVQVWFQNKRQHMRKQANQEREVTELPIVTSTPCKPPAMIIVEDPMAARAKRTASVSSLPSPHSQVMHGSVVSPLTGLLPRQALCPDFSIPGDFVVNGIKRHSPKHEDSPSESNKRLKLEPSSPHTKPSDSDSKENQCESQKFSITAKPTNGLPVPARIPLREISQNNRNDIAQNLLSLKSGNWA